MWHERPEQPRTIRERLLARGWVYTSSGGRQTWSHPEHGRVVNPPATTRWWAALPNGDQAGSGPTLEGVVRHLDPGV